MTPTELTERLEGSLRVQNGTMRLSKYALRVLPCAPREALTAASQIALETLRPGDGQAVRMRRTSRGVYWELADAK